MPQLTHQRCFHHAGREAVARCLECQRFFCRECVTEHDERLICAACLKKLASAPATRKWRLAGILHGTQFVAGIMVAWVFFFLMGRLLLSIPTSFHEGSLWKKFYLPQRLAEEE
jgi:hypothetical protein